LIYTTSCTEDRGREIFKTRYIFRGSYPFPLMSKGKRKIESMKRRGAMVTGGVCVFPSMPKGEIVGKLVFIDANPRGSPGESLESPRSDEFI
jgi:hypothetical protein